MGLVWIINIDDDDAYTKLPIEESVNTNQILLSIEITRNHGRVVIRDFA